MPKLLLLTLLLASTLVMTGCGGGPGQTGPRVTISGLSPGDVVAVARSFNIDAESAAGLLRIDVAYGTFTGIESDFNVGLTEFVSDYPLQLQHIPPGAHTLVVSATDHAGETTTVTVPFSVPDAPPQVSFSQADGQFFDEDIELTVTTSDDVGLVFTELGLNDDLSSGVHDPPLTGVRTSNFIILLDQARPGENTVTFRVRDTAGQETTGILTFFTPL
jgi:hypothetical protein